ncbi:DUF2652 domain-containing protein [Methylocapsa sp. S129]|uniref:DUF2652 domain-containing protein n=1 Tax=Methylocapsa sp. S129 TaxID=1641869 RepID=UPI00131C804B|nr:DUF2652 domain-containing protein [Methylocapsa sp. S129]
MLPKTESACFVIADISGYTNFMSGAELDHAQDIIADIMDTLLRALRPTFRLAKFEGDAAFVYALANKVDGSLLQDAIESAYFAFRKRLRSIKQANSCECQACSLMQSLDVKFVVHYGEFIKQRMGGQEELAGRDVILVHRLLKNEVNKKFGRHAYALYSDACVRAMEIDPAAQGLAEHDEAIDIIGETKCWIRDLEQAWTTENEATRIIVDRDRAFRVIERDFAPPPPAVWEFVTSPAHHSRWQRSDSLVEAAVNGRRGAGTRNHCVHGKDAIIEDILDWRPFDYVTLTALLPIPGASKILFTYAFEGRADGGTRFELRFAKPKPKDLAFFEQVWPTVRSNFEAGLDILRSMLEERAAASDVAGEPSIPVSRERFLTQPVHAH